MTINNLRKQNEQKSVSQLTDIKSQACIQKMVNRPFSSSEFQKFYKLMHFLTFEIQMYQDHDRGLLENMF